MSLKKHVAVIGGGYTGLTAALRLAQAGHRVTVLENTDRLGGMAGTIPFHDTELEFFYHHWFTSDQAILDLLDELGIGGNLHRFPSKMGFFAEDRIWNFGTPMDLLRFRPLSFVNRLRFGLGALWLRDFVKNWKRLEDQTAHEAMPRYVGQQGYDVIWEPLLKGKFSSHYKEVAMVWLWGKLRLRGSSRSKDNSSQEELLYPAGSFRSVTDALKNRLNDLDVDIRISTPVECISTCTDGNGLLECQGIRVKGETLAADAVLHTASSEILCKLAPDLPAAWREQVMKLKHAAAVCLLLGLNRSFSDIYWLNIGDLSLPFNAVIEQTNLVPKDLYGGIVPLYVSRYLQPEDTLYQMDTQELVERYLPSLQRINPAFDKSWIVSAESFRTRFAQPVIPCHYSEIKPDFATPVRGLFMANLSQIYPEDRGTNYSVDLGNRVAPLIKDFLEE